jgi:hypothetical protein
MPNNDDNLADFVSTQQKVNTDLFAARDEARARIKEITYRIAEMERVGRGTTLANKRAAQLERKLQKIESDFSEYGASKAVLDELTRLDTSTKNLYLEVAGHGDRIRALEQSDAMKIDFQNSGVEVAHTTDAKFDTPWVEAFIVGVVAFLLTAFALNAWIAQDWNATKDFWASLIVGAAAFFVMASFEKLRLGLQIQARHVWVMKEQPAENQQPSAATTQQDRVDA